MNLEDLARRADARALSRARSDLAIAQTNACELQRAAIRRPSPEAALAEARAWAEAGERARVVLGMLEAEP